MSIRSWRKESVPSAGKVSWRLVAGRAADRVRLNLGRVTEDQAEAARARLQAHEDQGTAGPVLALYQQDERGEADARSYLLGDPGKAELLPAPRVDYSAMRLRDYFRDRYAPWRGEARPAAWKSEQSHWRRILAGPLADLRLSEICKDRRLVFRWLDELRVEPSGGVRRGTARAEGAFVPDGTKTKPASGAYKRLLRAAIQALLTRAFKSGDIDLEVELAKGLTLEGSTRRARPKAQALTKDEFSRLLAASEGKHRALWGVAVGLGLRPSELCRLRWEHVRWSTTSLGSLLVPGTKTETSAAEVPLTATAHRELEAWWKASGEPAEGIIFPGDRHDRKKSGVVEPYAAAGYKRALRTAATRAGIERPVTPYCLRHSFATLALAEGLAKDTVRATLRHTDPHMIDKVYDGRGAEQHGPEAARFGLG